MKLLSRFSRFLPLTCAVASLFTTFQITLLNAQEIHVSASAPRAQYGQTVDFDIVAPGVTETIKAAILVPSVGVAPLAVHKLGSERYKAAFTVPKHAPDGIYAVQVWTEGSKSAAAGKATFLVGKVIADFFEPAFLDKANPIRDLDAYLTDFSGLGGNLIIAHSIITADRAYFPCAICKVSPPAGSSSDIVEMLLRRADSRGIGVLLSISWDMTHQSPYKDRWAETQTILRELYRQYGKHPSLIGFYTYQEGSGTYYVPYVRTFTSFVKGLNAGLLTACAPYVDDPLLAGYLGDLPDLDIIMYQAMVMASYRPDNREHYPIRRAKDFCSLSAGAKKLQNKIAITHVELFGYRENNIGSSFTNYQNQYEQFLSVATVAENDGIAMFAYHPLIYSRLKSDPRAIESRRAVVDGLRAFKLLSSTSDSRALVAAYFPYSDWNADRWSQSYLPAFDAFRILGIPLDILPYEPPTNESLLPYYPLDPNPDVLARLLRTRTVLVLPNVSGFQRTDSELIKEFVRQGGTVIAFGPQIPTGNSYKRSEVFGVTELPASSHAAFTVQNAVGTRAPAGSRWSFPNKQLPSWRSTGARAIATFGDGSIALAENPYGKGTVVIFATDAMTAARYFPGLVRDIIDSVLSKEGKERAVDILGGDTRIDDAVSQTASGFRVAVVNHNHTPLDITLQPLNRFAGRQASWFDLRKNEQGPIYSGSQPLRLSVPPGEFRAVEWKPGVQPSNHAPHGRGARNE